LRAAVEITEIVSMPGGITQRAVALLEPLRQVAPFQGAWLSLLDPERREQPPLVSYGYPAGLTQYMSSPAGVAEIEHDRDARTHHRAGDRPDADDRRGGPDRPQRAVLARITVLSCGGQPARHLAGVLVVSPPGNLHGLTTRGLEVLGLLVEDWSVRRIGAALDLSVPTVADRVERILTKLTATSRTVAVVRALRQGLYIPRSLRALHSGTG
jgi:DNA-binding NarL/FixJ family response regulator